MFSVFSVLLRVLGSKAEMNVVVIGAGAIGSVYGAKLSAQHEVTLVGRPDHVQAIQQHGLRLEGGTTGTYAVNATTRLESTPPLKRAPTGTSAISRSRTASLSLASSSSSAAASLSSSFGP